MPVFLFACTNEACGCELETYLPSYKTPAPACPECSAAMKRLIAGAVSHSLKGSNWSTDGYASTDRAEEAKSIRADRKGRPVSFPGQKVRST